MNVLLWCIFISSLYYTTAEDNLTLSNLLKELSWALRLKVLHEIQLKHTTSTPSTLRVTRPTAAKTETILTFSFPEGLPTSPVALRVAKNQTAKAKTHLSRRESKRRVGVHALVLPQNRRDFGTPGQDGQMQPLEDDPLAQEKAIQDDNDMRIKLFRLMYETVRDSDLKVKRAELIKDHYTNSSAFEIGYLIGDITDKANIITDISTTLKRFQHEWKPIEHINAYEQIANQAIEITHLIDLVRVVTKRENTPHSRTFDYPGDK